MNHGNRDVLHQNARFHEATAPCGIAESAGLCALEASQSNTLLGIQQSIMLGELAVNRVLDNLDPR